METKKTNDIKSCQDKSKGYVIERYNDFLDETQFLDKNDYWTSFLTEAKVFYSENEAKEYWDNCRVSRHGFKVYFRYY